MVVLLQFWNWIILSPKTAIHSPSLSSVCYDHTRRFHANVMALVLDEARWHLMAFTAPCIVHPTWHPVQPSRHTLVCKLYMVHSSLHHKHAIAKSFYGTLRIYQQICVMDAVLNTHMRRIKYALLVAQCKWDVSVKWCLPGPLAAQGHKRGTCIRRLHQSIWTHFRLTKTLMTSR